MRWVGWMPPESYAARLGLSYRFFGRAITPVIRRCRSSTDRHRPGHFLQGIIGERRVPDPLDQIVEIASELLQREPGAEQPPERIGRKMPVCFDRLISSIAALYSAMPSAIASERSGGRPADRASASFLRIAAPVRAADDQVCAGCSRKTSSSRSPTARRTMTTS